jgi:hypothetical protein
MNSYKVAVLLSISATLFACGGGGSETTAPMPVTATPQANPTVNITDASITEGNAGNKQLEFTVTLSDGDGTSFSIDYATSDITATSSEDYEPTTGTLAFDGTGQESETISVLIYGDVDYANNDPTETFSVVISNSSLTGKMEAIGTIENDDMTESESLAQAISLISEQKDGRINRDFHTYNANLTIDLGGDGDMDYIMLFADEVDAERRLNEEKPMSYLINNRGQGFEVVNTDIKAFYRFYKLADVNGDGLDDIFFVADHLSIEVNGETLRQSSPYLLIQNPDGTLVDRSDGVSEIFGDWHGLEALDSDNDGDIDFIASALHTGLYAFINDGLGNFSVEQSMLPITELDTFTRAGDPFYTSIHSIDLDKDGFKEILLGSQDDTWRYADGNPRIPVLRNRVSSYTFDSTTDTLDAFYTESASGTTQVIISMASIDFDQDACTDAVVYQTDYSNNHTISVFKSDCLGNMSVEYVFHENMDRNGDQVRVDDINGDGFDDIYIIQSGLINNKNAPILMNDGNGSFNKITYSESLEMDLLSEIYFLSPDRNY